MAGQVAYGPKNDRSTFGDRGVGDDTLGIRSRDTRRFTAMPWNKQGRDAATDPESPSAEERVRGERALRGKD